MGRLPPKGLQVPNVTEPPAGGFPPAVKSRVIWARLPGFTRGLTVWGEAPPPGGGLRSWWSATSAARQEVA